MAVDGIGSPVAAKAPAGGGRPPVLAEGVQLIGEYEQSGFKEPPSLVRRADGQTLQLPELLYVVATQIDGHRSYDEIGRRVSEQVRRGVDAESVRFLVEEKLRPIGVVAAADGTSPDLPKPDPFLGFKLRIGVIPERVSNRLGDLFKFFFWPPIVLAVLAAFVAADWWLFAVHGLAQSVRETVYSPGLFLPLLAAMLASAAFHEVGHAAGCRYGGARPGKMGCGLYLAWPAFYTDVTDAYRLNRRGRLRTDLGGVYFNMIVVVATVGAYLATGFEPLLVLVLFQHIEIVHQLLPVVRLDGYYIVADLTGVPDLFARIRPILRSMIPGRPADEQVTVLKPWVRVAVTAWVLVVVPLLLFELFVLLLHLPRVLGTALDSGGQVLDGTREAFAAGEVLSAVGGTLQLLLLAVPMVGLLWVLARTFKGAGGWMLTRTEGRPVLRFGAFGLSALAALALVSSWVSPFNYEPIRPGERGTLANVNRAVLEVRNLPAAEPAVAEPTTTTTTLDERPAGSTTTVASTTTTTSGATTTTVPATSTTTPATTTPPTTAAP